MNRNTRTIIVLAVALAVAGVASYAVYVAVQRATPKEEVAQAACRGRGKPLPVGTLLTADDVKLVVWPSSNPIPARSRASSR